jgi:hypothetical protein
MEDDIKEKIKELIYYLDDIKGDRLFIDLKKKGLNNILKTEEDNIAFIVLQFLIIPFLSLKEISSLLSENLYVGLHIDDLEITERIRKKLLFMDLADRDEFKENLKRSLLNNTEKIIKGVKNEDGKNLISVRDWLLDYIGQFEGNSQKSLVKAQYFNKKHIKSLKEDKYKLIKDLTSLYDFLNTSSFTPEGFEDDLLMTQEDGKLVTTHKGEVVVLFDPNDDKNSVHKRQGKIGKNIGIPKTKAEKEIDTLSHEEEKYKEGGLERLVIDEEIDKKKRVEDLQIEINKYKENSLERRALEDELGKIRG